MAQEAPAPPAPTPEAPEAPTPAPAPETPPEEPQKGEPETFTKEYVSGLRKEAAKYRTEAQAAREKAQEYEDRDKSELEKASGQRDRARSEVDRLKTENMRLRVAIDKGLVGDRAALADRLQGETQEEMTADAEKLLSLMKPEAESRPSDFDGGARAPAPPSKDAGEQHNELLVELFGKPT